MDARLVGRGGASADDATTTTAPRPLAGPVLYRLPEGWLYDDGDPVRSPVLSAVYIGGNR